MDKTNTIPAHAIENFRVLRTCGLSAAQARAIVIKGLAAENAHQWQGRR